MLKKFLVFLVPIVIGSCGFEKSNQDGGNESSTLDVCRGSDYRFEEGTCWIYGNRWNPALNSCEWGRVGRGSGCGGSTPPPQQPPNVSCSGSDYRYESSTCWIYTNRWAPHLGSCEWGRTATASLSACGITQPTPRPPAPPTPRPTPPPPRHTPPPRPVCNDTDYRIEANSCIRYDEVYNSSFNSCRWERFGQVSDTNCGIVRPTCSGFDYRWSSNRCERYQHVYNSSSNSCRWEYDSVVGDVQCGIVRPSCSGFDYRWTSNRCERYENVYNSSSNSCTWSYDSIVSDSQCGVFPQPQPPPRQPTPWPTPNPWPQPDPWPTPDPYPYPTPLPPQPGPMVDVRVENATLVKALPKQSATLANSQKCSVSAGTRFSGRVLRYAEGNHVKFAVTSGLHQCQDLLRANNGSIFIYLPHVSF